MTSHSHTFVLHLDSFDHCVNDDCRSLRCRKTGTIYANDGARRIWYENIARELGVDDVGIASFKGKDESDILALIHTAAHRRRLADT